MSISVVAACVSVTGAAKAAIIREDFDITNGWVEAMALAGNTLYIGGNFTQVGPATGSGVPIDASSGAPLSGYPKLSVGSKISAAVSDGFGGWFICGNFTAVGGVPRPGIAHLLGNNTVSAWNPNPDGPVSVLAVSGSTVYAAGRFDRIGGQFSSRLAALDATTGLARSWTPGPNGDITVLSVSGTTVYAGGSFTSIGGQPRSGFAALDASTGRATAWNPNANAAVSVLAVGAATVYASGAFTSIGGQARNGIAALDAATGLATGWNPNPNGGVAALAVSGATIYAGGSFTTIGGQVRYKIAALDATTGFATGWHPDASVGSSGFASVTALAVSGTTVYVGGSFTLIGGQPRIDLAALDATTGLATAWDPNPNADPRFDPPAVSTLAANGTAVYVGGSFTSIGGQARNYIAAIDVLTGRATAWKPDANYIVSALAVSGSTVYAGGTFDFIGGQSRSNIAALDATTGLATTWDPYADTSFPGSYPSVNVLTVGGNTIYAGGWFNIIGWQARDGIAALDATTGLATAWNPHADSRVDALAVSGNTIYAGGWFYSIGGQTRHSIAALDATSGLATAWNPNAGLVNAIALSGETVFVGGSFKSAGGQPRNDLAALDATTGLATAWNPNPNANGGVFALAVGNATLYAGGYFTSMGNLPQSYLAAILTDVPTPTLLSLVSAQAEPDRVRLTWFTANGPALTATVYRSTGASDWLAVGQAAADGTGKIIFEDPDVSPGGRYGYRLGVVQGGQEEFLGEAWVDVPRAVGFALAGMRPNPAAQEYRVAFSLPDGGPARLELMDLAGRRVAARDVGTLGAGNHLVNPTQGQTLAPGVYLLRLTRGARSLTARAVVIR